MFDKFDHATLFNKDGLKEIKGHYGVTKYEYINHDDGTTTMILDHDITPKNAQRIFKDWLINKIECISGYYINETK